MKNFRAEGELPGEVTLEICRASERATGGNQQVLMPSEIDDRAKVECGVRAATGGQGGAMINFSAEKEVLGDLALDHETAKAPVFIACAGIQAVTAATVKRPRAKTFLQPKG